MAALSYLPRASAIAALALSTIALAPIATAQNGAFSVAPAAAAPAAEVPAYGPSAEQLSKLPPEVRAKIEAEMKARGAKPGGPAEAKPADGKPEDKQGEDKSKSEESTTIKRPTTPPPAAEEIKAKPDKDGMVQFSFRGQPWTEVLQWFADVSGASLDWQELPADYLNLTASRRYTIPETRDLLNRHLLARGFTMLRQGDVLTVVKIEKIEPSLVPTVDQDELEDYAPHDFVKVRYEIPESIDPAKAADDVKVLLSPSAKVTALVASKRLLVIDAVANQRSVRDLFYSEQSAAKADQRPRIFPIRYRRAEYVADQIMIVLGIDVKKRQSPMEQQMAQQAEQQRMQMMMQMQQQNGGKNMANMMKKEEPEVHIAVDRRRNVLLVNAPPKEMAVIARTIAEIDVAENGGLESSSAAVEGEASNSDEISLEKYQTVTANPESVVSALQELGGLSPRTQLQADPQTKTIFAYATAADHATIKRMINKLDANGRSLRVIWLNRRSPADQVAGTIVALMIGESKKNDEDQGRRFFYFNPYGDRDKKPESSFRIQPDIENNRLLLWANDAEYDEVVSLLQQLGATSVVGRGGGPARWRVLESRTADETARLLEQLQSTWAGKNRLDIHVQEPADKKEQKPQEAQPPANETPARDKTTRHAPSIRFVEFSADSDAKLADETDFAQSSPKPADSEPPPIKITVTPDGRIILSSDDVAALDQLEDLLADLEPRRQEFEVFQLHNSRASLVALNLEEYFADELNGKQESMFNIWGDYMGRRDKDSGPLTLAKRPPLRFIWDSDTNTIVAQNASPSQLRVIRKLVEIYDQPVGEEAVAKRRTEVIPIRYSKASVIAASLKEVYRDLLSSKDKEFQGGKDGEQKSRTETYFRFFGGDTSNDKNKKSAPVKMAFEGALSVGVDDVSNTLIISAEENVWASVYEIVRELDEKAKPDTVVQVHELRGSIQPDDLRKVLASIMSKPWPGGKPESAQAAQNNGDRNRGDNQNRNRGK